MTLLNSFYCVNLRQIINYIEVVPNFYLLRLILIIRKNKLYEIYASEVSFFR
jgi:hypothetical protein